jgi:hypothetical protein
MLGAVDQRAEAETGLQDAETELDRRGGFEILFR